MNRRARARLDGSRAAILNLHRVLPQHEADALSVEPGMYVTPESFRLILETLRCDLTLCPLIELADALIDGRSFPRGACALTFDDGWRDNFDYALPLLREFDVPATIFVVTERIGTKGAFWPDEVCRLLAHRSASEVARIVAMLGIESGARDAAAVLEAWKGLSEGEREEPLARLRSATVADSAAAAEGKTTRDAARELMTWEELEAMQSAGIAIESHGATHSLLMHQSPEEADRELRTSLATLEARGFARGRLFAYPSGQHDPALARRVEAAGYRAGFALDEATVRPTQSRWTIPRLGVHQGIAGSRAEFRTKMPGWN